MSEFNTKSPFDREYDNVVELIKDVKTILKGKTNFDIEEIKVKHNDVKNDKYQLFINVPSSNKEVQKIAKDIIADSVIRISDGGNKKYTVQVYINDRDFDARYNIEDVKVDYYGPTKDPVIKDYVHGKHLNKGKERTYRNFDGMLDLSGVDKMSGASDLEIKEGAFRNNNINFLRLPGRLSTIEAVAFEKNPINKLEFGPSIDDNPTIGKDAFKDCEIEDIILPMNVTLEEKCFINNPVKEIVAYSINVPEDFDGFIFGSDKPFLEAYKKNGKGLYRFKNGKFEYSPLSEQHKQSKAYKWIYKN